MTPIIWTKAATTDLERHYSFLEPIDSDIAQKAVKAILKAGESLKKIPVVVLSSCKQRVSEN